MSAIETIAHKGYKIEVRQDEFPEDPREWSNLGKMVCWHNRYNLGDEHGFSTPESFRAYADTMEDKILAFPLYLYDHGGLTIKTGSFHGLLPQGHVQFDSMQVGWIYVTKEEWKAEGITKEQADEQLQSEVETYNDYLTGNVYGYIAHEPNGDELHSCWSFFGDYHKYMLPEVKGEIDHDIKEKLNKHTKQVKAWIRNNVPLVYRTPLTI